MRSGAPEVNHGRSDASSESRTGACHACRTRKVKCDRQDACSRCIKHDIECAYDEIPNRRGPDRAPRRRRLSKLQQAQQRRNDNEDPSTSRSRADPSIQAQNTQNFTMVAYVPPAQGQTPSSSRRRGRDSSATRTASPETKPPTDSPLSSAPEREADDVQVDEDLNSSSGRSSVVHRTSGNGHSSPSSEVLRSESSSISSNPSLQFYRRTWWGLLVSAYSPTTDDPVGSIYRDLAIFFKNASHNLSMLHLPTFFRNVAQPQTRERMQPSLILSLLALSSVMQARCDQPSKLELAMRFHSWSHAAFEASINAQWIDIQLAQAAIFMSFFEATPQSLQNYDRLTAAWNRIDVLTTALGLDHIDTDNPSAFVIERSAQSGTYLDSLYSLYAATAIPNESSPPTPIDYNKNPCQANGTVDPPSPGHSTDSPSPQGSLSPLSSNSDHIETSACSCQRTALMTNGWGDGATRLSTSSLWSPGWLEDWSPEEIEKEEGRRVFWTTLSLVGYGLSHQTAHNTPRARFHIVNLPRIAVYFPGEALHFARGLQPSARTTVWALNARAHLLWVAAIQLDEASARGSMSPERKAPIAAQVWFEMERLTTALNKHQCGIEATQLFTARYFLQFSRMIATKDFSQHVPSAHAGVMLPQRREAEAWIAHLKFFIDRANAPEERHDLMRGVARNPWMVWSLVDHTRRCLDLWNKDPTLLEALEVANRMQPALWAIIQKYQPVPFLERFGRDLTARLREARDATGICGRSNATPSPPALQIASPDLSTPSDP